jgi:ABC-type dipeptide/oligopeptide/nickel transport system ATPase component
MLKHFFICGASGSGKSVLMQSMFYDQIRTSAKREHSQILIEPHGDFSGKIAFARIIDKERLVFISSGNTINRDAHTEGITGIFNPFLNDGSEEMRYCLTHELTNAIAELLESSQHATQFGITVQMATLLSPAIAVTLASPEPSIHTRRPVTNSQAPASANQGFFCKAMGFGKI